MKFYIAMATVLDVKATASSDFLTTTKDTASTATAAAAAVRPITYPPICKFNPDKGKYICPVDAEIKASTEDNDIEGMNTKNINIDDINIKDTSSKDNSAVTGADCNKCQRDWDDCMSKWGCWFYDCNNPCKCHVAKNDPSCKECSSGQCHA